MQDVDGNSVKRTESFGTAVNPSKLHLGAPTTTIVRRATRRLNLKQSVVVDSSHMQSVHPPNSDSGCPWKSAFQSHRVRNRFLGPNYPLWHDAGSLESSSQSRSERGCWKYNPLGLDGPLPLFCVVEMNVRMEGCVAMNMLYGGE